MGKSRLVQNRLELATITDQEYKGFDLGMGLFMRDDCPDPLGFVHPESDEEPRPRKRRS